MSKALTFVSVIGDKARGPEIGGKLWMLAKGYNLDSTVFTQGQYMNKMCILSEEGGRPKYVLEM